MGQEALQNYAKAIRDLKKECNDTGISDDEFQQLYFESLKKLNNSNNYHSKFKLCIKLFCVVLTILLCFLAVYNCKTIYSCLVCNLQEYIYPGLRLWRQISIPLISLFPALTDLHQETCLIQNPYFSIVDMDCWPCSSIQNVREIQDPQPTHRQHIGPFIYLTKQEQLSRKQLTGMYFKNKNTFDVENPKILVNNKYFTSLGTVFNTNENIRDDKLYIWRINTVNAARILRQYIPRPKIVPKFGQSSERFIIIDTNGNRFQIPDTECNYSFLLVLNGKRKITLMPAEECKHQCKSLEVNLHESYLLWYNWWYWRPFIQQSANNETFIAHVGSYC